MIRCGSLMMQSKVMLLAGVSGLPLMIDDGY